MVKAQCVVITVQVDMNLTFVSEVTAIKEDDDE